MAYIPDLIPGAERDHHLKGHMGARVGFGVRPAVLVVDMTRAFVEDRLPLGWSKTGEPAPTRSPGSSTTSRGRWGCPSSTPAAAPSPVADRSEASHGL